MSDSMQPRRPGSLASGTRPWLLDLFCCQGGAGMGYHRAGFNIVGVDLEPQPRYPLTFRQGDALGWLERLAKEAEAGFPPLFAAIHASPPCQAYTDCQRIRGNDHPDLIGPTRDLLEAIGLPYVIENVPGARGELRDPVMLCGSMFPALRVYRHRYFEANFPIPVPEHPAHVHPQVKMGRAPRAGEWVQAVGNFSGVAEAREAMEVPWMNRDGIRESIPPAYTEHVGAALLAHLATGTAEAMAA